MAEDLVALDVSGQTDIGLKRQRNEDSFEYRIPASGSPQHPYGALFMVADGMGGMGGGDVASQTAVKEVMQQYYTAETPDPLASLRAALEVANVAVREQAKQLNRVRIGSTAAGLVLMPSGDAILFNVGDSRVYRVRQNYIELMTHDQSVLQGQIDGGLISEEDARQARNVNVTAFIGQPTPLQPVFRRAQAQLGDIFVICSDGLWDLVEPHELLNIVQRMPAEAAGRKLIALARQRGAPDNITVIVVRLGPKPQPRRLWLWGTVAVAALILVAAGAVYALMGGNASGKNTATPTTSQVAAAVVEATETLSAAETSTAVASPSEPTATTVSGIVVFTSTPTHTPTITPTFTPSNTPTKRPTNTPTASLTATYTPRPTLTPTARPSATMTGTPLPTQPPTDTPLPTQPPTNTPKPSATRPPTITPTVEPTVTLDPTVITWTPSPSPSPTPTLSPAEQMLVWADQEGVKLATEATLYQLYQTSGSEAPTVLKEIQLLPGTEVRLLNDKEQPHPTQPDLILREVTVVDGLNRGQGGWIDQTVLENALPVVPRVVTKDVNSVNIRSGDNLVFDVVGRLQPGEYATILGISSRDPLWYQVQLPDDTIGWVSSGVVTTIGDVRDLSPITPPAFPRPRASATPVTAEAPVSTPQLPVISPPTSEPSSGGGGGGGPKTTPKPDTNN
jgi:serine/threonine protein phosphatase PrpC